MADIRPFAAIRYAAKPGSDLSDLVAPPYDVLDQPQKDALIARNARNIVAVDLPHLPPKSVGPDEVYQRAGETFRAWLADGTLKQDTRAALYPYAQNYEHNGRSYHRRGFFALVKLTPFGAGPVVPHEKTYPVAIEDRMKLMRATRVQLSPIFGLFPDPRSEVTRLVFRNAGRPQLVATIDGVTNHLWSEHDAVIEDQVMRLMGDKSIYIADGHHRYTTALQYKHEAEVANGGPLPPAHPANWCLFNLVSMQDDGLLILPTHRVIGGLKGFDIAKFKQLVAGVFNVAETSVPEESVGPFTVEALPHQPAHTFALFDGATRKLYHLACTNPDILQKTHPGQSEAWRSLDVAILQHYLIEQVLQPHFAAGAEPTKSYTAVAGDVVGMCDGTKNQIAILLRPTPLHALENLGKAGEVMPQKSTYFYPKLATGLVINPLA